MNEQGLSGNLQETPFAEIAGVLYRGRRSGALTLSSGERARTVVFYEGSPVAVVSPDPRDHVARILAAKGKISQEDAGKLQDSPMTKSALQSAEFIDGDILTWGLKFRFVNLCYDLFRWTEGTYSFDEGPPPRDIFLMKVPTPVLLARGVKHMTPSALLERVPSDLEVGRGGEESGDVGSLGEEEKALAAQCREGMSVGEILDASGMEPPRVREILYVLQTLGDLTLRPPAPSGAGGIGTAGDTPPAPEEKEAEPIFEIERHSYEAEPAVARGEDGPVPAPREGLAPIGDLGEESKEEAASPPGLSPIGFDEPLPAPDPGPNQGGRKSPPSPRICRPLPGRERRPSRVWTDHSPKGSRKASPPLPLPRQRSRPLPGPGPSVKPGR